LSTPPPGEYPRLAGLGDLSRLLTGEHAHHGLPPGVNWSWLAFPEAWPLVRLQAGNYPGPAAPVGEAGDWWWFTLAEMQSQQLLFGSGWLEQIAERISASFVGPLAAAFSALGALPLIWTVPDYERPPMPAFQPHYRLQFGGSLFTVEGWSCRLNITSAGTLMDSAAADAAFPALYGAVNDWVQDPGAALSVATTLEYVKFNEINALGHYAHPGSVRENFWTTPNTGHGGDAHALAGFPPQVSVVVSLLTAQLRGRAHRGRMFTPALAAYFATSTGLVDNASLIAAAATTLLNAINAAVPDHGVSIISASGESNHVTQVAVGHVFDTMRTRRKSMAEAPYTLGTALA